jgi:flavorubredoxin
MKFNGEKILIIPVPGTHTPTDVLIYFRRADVLFTGDFMTSGRFKKQDESSEKYEKRIKGYVDILGPYLIDVLEAVTKICSSNTKCLGGHNTTFHIRNVNEYLHIAKKMIKD